jgi:hypothetical protein
MLRHTDAARRIPDRHRQLGVARLSLLHAAALLVGLTAAGCAPALPARSTAIDRMELVKSATFDHGCPAADIRVLEAGEAASGAGVFLLDVCGTRRHYTRVGSMYFDRDRSGS